MTYARCLTEGVDVPAIDAVYFCDPKYSKIDIVQAAGRALRQDKEKDKKFGHIFVPVYHNKADDLEERLSSGAFSQLVSVVRAMSDQDGRIEEEIREIVYGEGVRKSSQQRIRIDVDRVKLIEIIGFENKLKQSIFFDVIRKTFVPFRPFEQARAFVCKLNLKSVREWKAYCNGEIKNKPLKPGDVPAHPDRIYKNKGWKGMGDWIGTGRIANQDKTYRVFIKARAFVHKLNLKSGEEWKAYSKGKSKGKPKKPNGLPSAPWLVYGRKDWNGMGDWLGTGRIANFDKTYRAFIKARAFAYCKGKIKDKTNKPDDIPTCPDQTYKRRGWEGMGDWLGTGTMAPGSRKYWRFKKARAFVHKLNLKSHIDWMAYCKGQIGDKPRKPDDVPGDPYRVYRKKGWKNWGDWLGTGTIGPRLRAYRPFVRARAFVHNLNLKSHMEWRVYSKGQTLDKPKRPDNIPGNPYYIYRKKDGKIGRTGSGRSLPAKAKEERGNFMAEQGLLMTEALKRFSLMEEFPAKKYFIELFSIFIEMGLFNNILRSSKEKLDFWKDIRESKCVRVGGGSLEDAFNGIFVHSIIQIPVFIGSYIRCVGTISNKLAQIINITDSLGYDEGKVWWREVKELAKHEWSKGVVKILESESISVLLGERNSSEHKLQKCLQSFFQKNSLQGDYNPDSESILSAYLETIDKATGIIKTDLWQTILAYKIDKSCTG